MVLVSTHATRPACQLGYGEDFCPGEGFNLTMKVWKAGAGRSIQHNSFLLIAIDLQSVLRYDLRK